MIWVKWIQKESVSELGEMARLEKEIQMTQHFGWLQPWVCHFHIWFMKMECEAVMKEMAVMRNDQKDQIDFGRDCQVLTFMVNQLFAAAIAEKKVCSGAVHCDVVEDYSAAAVIRMMRKFAALRGWPTLDSSDPGSQLVSTEGKLESWYQDMKAPL